MDLREMLKEAQYVKRSDEHGEYLDDVGQCGFGCDHSRLINNDGSGKECYRYCEKFRMRVSEYDSCKYFSDDKFVALIGEMAGLLNATNYSGAGVHEQADDIYNKQMTPKKNSSKINLLLWIILAAIFGVLV